MLRLLAKATITPMLIHSGTKRSIIFGLPSEMLQADAEANSRLREEIVSMSTYHRQSNPMPILRSRWEFRIKLPILRTRLFIWQRISKPRKEKMYCWVQNVDRTRGHYPPHEIYNGRRKESWGKSPRRYEFLKYGQSDQKSTHAMDVDKKIRIRFGADVFQEQWS